MAEEKKTTTKRTRKKKTKTSTNPSTEAKKAIAAEEAKQAEQDAAKKAEEEKIKADEEAAKAEAEAKEKEKEELEKPKKSTKSTSKIKLPEVEKVKIMLRDYVESASKGVATPATRKKQVDKLVKLVTFLANNPKKEVINEAYDTFKKERNGVMHESLLLQGVSHLNASTREKVELLYGAFVLTLSNTKAKKKIRPNIDLLTKRFGDGVGSWFAAKNK